LTNLIKWFSPFNDDMTHLNMRVTQPRAIHFDPNYILLNFNFVESSLDQHIYNDFSNCIFQKSSWLATKRHRKRARQLCRLLYHQMQLWCLHEAASKHWINWAVTGIPCKQPLGLAFGNPPFAVPYPLPKTWQAPGTKFLLAVDGMWDPRPSWAA
jgi:hypothetical protein